jgi:hypothetical protein
MDIFIRRYLGIVDYFNTFFNKLSLDSVTPSEIDGTLEELSELIKTDKIIGDRSKLSTLLEQAKEQGGARKEELIKMHDVLQQKETFEKEKLAKQAEDIASETYEKTQWKQAHKELIAVIEHWRIRNKENIKIDEGIQKTLWGRIKEAKRSFEKAQDEFFDHLTKENEKITRMKLKLIEDAQRLSAQTSDMEETTRELMDLTSKWKSLPRLKHGEENKLWKQFQESQNVFFSARNEKYSEENKQLDENFDKKLAIIEKIEAILPIKDLKQARKTFANLQKQLDDLGRVSQKNLILIDKRVKKVENKIKEEEQKEWKETDPEISSRTNSFVSQLTAQISELEAKIKTASKDKKQKLTDELETKKQWLKSFSK